MRNKSKLVNKTIYLVLMVIVLVFGLVACLPTDNKPTNINNNNSLKGNGDTGTKGDNGFIDIQFPNDKSVLEIGNGYRISWESNNVGYVDINLYGINIDNKELLVMNIAIGIENMGYYDWEILPDFLTEEGLYFMEDNFKLVISDSNGNAEDRVSYFVITSPINYETEEETPKGRGAKEDIPNSRTVDMVNNRFVDGGLHTVKWNTGSKYIEHINIYLYKNGEYYQTIAENVANTGTYEWEVNILPTKRETNGQTPVIEDSQILSNALTGILPSEISYMNDILGLGDVFNIVVLSGDLLERFKLAADSIPKPYWRGIEFYKIAKAIADDMPDLTDEEKKELTLILCYYFAHNGFKIFNTVVECLNFNLNGTKAAQQEWDFHGHNLDMDGDGDLDVFDITEDPFEDCENIYDILNVLEGMHIYNGYLLSRLIDALNRLGYYLDTDNIDNQNNTYTFLNSILNKAIVITGQNIYYDPVTNSLQVNTNNGYYNSRITLYSSYSSGHIEKVILFFINSSASYLNNNSFLVIDKIVLEVDNNGNIISTTHWYSIYQIINGELFPYNEEVILSIGYENSEGEVVVVTHLFLGGGHNYIVFEDSCGVEHVYLDDNLNGTPDSLEDPKDK